MSANKEMNIGVRPKNGRVEITFGAADDPNYEALILEPAHARTVAMHLVMAADFIEASRQ